MRAPLSLTELLLAVVFPAALWGGIMLGVGASARSQGRKQLEVWREVVDQLGLAETAAAAPMFSRTYLEAREGRRRVRIERFKPGKTAWFTRVVVEGSSGISLESESGKSILSRSLGELVRGVEADVEIGDEAFDEAVYVRGAADRVRARLDAETRKIVIRMVGGWLALPGRRPVKAWSPKMVDGNLEATIVEQDGPPTVGELVPFVDALLAIAARFHGPVDPASRLAANLENEPRWRVRLRNLEVLAESYPDTPATQEALRRALGDPEGEVRLRAAIALGDEGTETLIELAGEPGEDPVSSHAIGVLGDLLAPSAALAILQQALRGRLMETARACIEVLFRAGGREAEAQLIKVLTVETGSLAVAAAKALAEIGAEEAEDELIAALRRDIPGLRLAAVEALGRIGSAAAVMPIEEAAKVDRSDTEVRRAARQAIAAIQSRLLGASPGQLSIAEGEAGQLSLADDDARGRVSLPEGERGS